MDIQCVWYASLVSFMFVHADAHSHSVNAESTPIATIGPCAYRKAKKEVIRNAVKVIDQRRKRKQVTTEGAWIEKRARMD